MIIGNLQRTWLRRAAAGAAACLLSIAVASPALAQDAAKPADKPADATPPAPFAPIHGAFPRPLHARRA